MLLALFATCYSQLSPTKPKNQAQEPPKTPQDRPQKPQDSPRWPQNGPQNVRQSLGKSGGDMLGSPFLAILGPPGPSWAHLGPLSQPSCHPTSPLGTFMAEVRPPKPHLASFVEPSTCPEHRYLRRFSEVCYLPSSQHVALNLALQNPKIKPKSLPRHPKIGPKSPKIAQDGPQDGLPNPQDGLQDGPR